MNEADFQKRGVATSPSFALSVGGMLLIAGCHTGIAYAAYKMLQDKLPSWGAILVALLVYWILRNIIVIVYRKRIRSHFWLVGEGHRAAGKTVSTKTKNFLGLLIGIYGDPFGAYAGEPDLIDSMEIMARPEVIDSLIQGASPPQISLGELYGLVTPNSSASCETKSE